MIRTSTVKGVREAFFARWNVAPITHSIAPPEPTWPVKFSRTCPCCENTISWQGWFSDVAKEAVKFGAAHWQHHEIHAAANPLLFWAETHKLTGLVPFPDKNATALIHGSPSGRTITPQVFTYPYPHLTDWAGENIRLLKRAGVRVYRHRGVNLMHDNDWQYLQTLWENGLAPETYRSMALARRKGSTP